jgi:hypothetical protein
MKKLIFVMVVLGLLVGVTGCSPVPFMVKSRPQDASPEMEQVANLQCHNQSQVSGPWLYGIGTYMYRRMAASRYQECMNKMGYGVVEQ